MTPSAAASRSALASTTAAFFPPSSSRQGLIQRPLSPAWIRMPTCFDPVNTTPSTPGCCQSGSPISSRRPTRRLNTPAGSPGVAIDLVQLEPGPGRVLGRLVDHRVAGHQRRRGHAGRQRQRKVEWRDAGEHAVRPEHIGVPLHRGDPRHRTHEAVGILDLLAVVIDQVGGLFRVAHGLEPALAHLEAHQRGQLVLPLSDDGRPHAGARRPAPARAGGPSPACARRAAATAASTCVGVAQRRSVPAPGWCRSGDRSTSGSSPCLHRLAVDVERMQSARHRAGPGPAPHRSGGETPPDRRWPRCR